MIFEDLKALVAVIECVSLTKAAERLSLTQSAVSRRIQHLEELLEATLFDRTCRPPAPTPLGFRVYESALGLLRGAEELRRIPQEGAPPRGKFRIGFIQVVTDLVVLDVVTSIRKTFPDLEMQVVTDWSIELQQRLTEGELEAATLLLTAPSSLPPALDGVLISTLDILVVQSKQHPLVESCTDLKGLSCNEWILNPKGCRYRAALESAMEAGGRTLKLGVDTLGAPVQIRMIAAGLGLGLIPKRLLQESPWRDELSIVDVSDFSLQMDIWLAHPLMPGNLKQANELLTQRVVEGFRR